MFRINFRNNRRGFSLLEILIYAGVFVVVAGSITGVLVNVLNVTSQQQASSEVDENLRQVVAIMGDKIRQSTRIETATSTNLVLKIGGVSTTTFSVADDILYLTEGENDPVSLLSSKVKVNSLGFRKIEQPGTKGGVRVNISLIYDDPKPSLSISKSLVSTINRAAALSFGEDILPSINNLYSVGADNPRWLNGYFSGSVNVDGNVDATQLCIAGDCKTAWSAISGIEGSGTANYISKWINNSILGNSLIYDDGTNVGIGTSNPTLELDVSGSIHASSNIKADSKFYGNAWDTGVYNFLNLTEVNPILSSLSNINIILDANNNNTDSYLGILKDNPDPAFASEIMRIEDNGNVGIGTTSPAQKLSVAGIIESTSGGIKFPDGTTQGTAATGGLWSSSGSNIYYNTGNVGIGTVSPSEKLDVVGNIELTGTVIPDNICGISGTVLQYSADSIDNNLVGGALGLTPAAENLHYGTTMVCPGTVNAISINCSKRLGGSISVEVGKNGVGQFCDVTGTVANTGYSTTGCSVSFSAGDKIGCYLKSYDAITDYIRFCECAIFVRFN